MAFDTSREPVTRADIEALRADLYRALWLLGAAIVAANAAIISVLI
ncbi:MAG: hypothetical protein OXG95_01640 [Chloroflexi bacterium]|nr:hypothetical protein [Chloroflexota bacterium]